MLSVLVPSTSARIYQESHMSFVKGWWLPMSSLYCGRFINILISFKATLGSTYFSRNLSLFCRLPNSPGYICSEYYPMVFLTVKSVMITLLSYLISLNQVFLHLCKTPFAVVFYLILKHWVFTNVKRKLFPLEESQKAVTSLALFDGWIQTDHRNTWW